MIALRLTHVYTRQECIYTHGIFSGSLMALLRKHGGVPSAMSSATDLEDHDVVWCAAVEETCQ
jgi:hypothetical protein